MDCRACEGVFDLIVRAQSHSVVLATAVPAKLLILAKVLHITRAEPINYLFPVSYIIFLTLFMPTPAQIQQGQVRERAEYAAAAMRWGGNTVGWQ